MGNICNDRALVGHIYFYTYCSYSPTYPIHVKHKFNVFAVGIELKCISFRYWRSGLNYDWMPTSHDLTDFIISCNRLSRCASNLHWISSNGCNKWTMPKARNFLCDHSPCQNVYLGYERLAQNSLTRIFHFRQNTVDLLKVSDTLNMQ